MKARLSWLSFRRALLPDHRAFGIGVGLMGGVTLAMAALVAAAASGTYSQLNDESTLSLVSIDAQGNGMSAPLNPDLLSRIAELSHVEQVIPWAQSGLMVADQAAPAIVWATATAPQLMPSCLPQYTCPSVLDEQSIILPTNAGGVDLTALAGKDVVFSYQKLAGVNGGDMQGVTIDVTLRVVGLYDAADAMADGYAAAYVSLANATAWEAAFKGMTPQQFVASGYDRVFVKADSAQNATSVVAALAAMGIPSMSYFALTHQMPQAFRLIHGLTLVLGGALLLVCLVVGTSLGSSIALSRRRVVGLLKAVGWTTPQVTLSLLGEVALLGLAVGLVAVLVGMTFGWVLVAAVGGRTIGDLPMPSTFALPSVWWFAGSVIGPVVAIVLGALPRTVRTSAMAPDDALRDL